ncbi:MAG: hypothetical protein JXB32_12155 [Deltaproteobacteria bacterium]|nr:hypothetical protein [Deltaproteobacteria bacterium]
MRTKIAAIVIGTALAIGFAIPGAWAKDAHSDAQFHCRAACNSDWNGCHTTCSRKPADERDDCDDECNREKSQCMTACDRM